MSLHRFFLDNQVLATEANQQFYLRLSDSDMKHARVLRLQPKEHIAVIDAASDYFECEVVSFDAAGLLVKIASAYDASQEVPTVILVQGLAKGDKMETVIRHTTELGVSGFIPLACKRSVVKLAPQKAQSKVQRWQAIAKSAAMQSGQNRVPEISQPQDIKSATAFLSEATAVLICWEEAPQSATLSQALHKGMEACVSSNPLDARVAVVVGPEGGLTEEEVQMLLSCNPRSSLVSLGPSILRTETAGIVASALALYELGGLGNKQ